MAGWCSETLEVLRGKMKQTLLATQGEGSGKWALGFYKPALYFLETDAWFL
jgi:hypothetical protein